MNENKQSVPASPVLPLTLQSIGQRLGRQKMLFIIVLLLCLLLAALLSWMITPVYRAGSTIQIEKQGAQIVDFGELNKPTPDMGESIRFSVPSTSSSKAANWLLR